MATTFTERVLNFLKDDRATLKKVTTAIGQAIKQEIAENKKAGKASFHVLEGVVYKHKSGKYEFIPSTTMKQILDGDSIVSPILAVEESRFLELLKLAMYELSESQIQEEQRKKEEEKIEKDRKLAKEEQEKRRLAEEEKRKKEGW